LRQTFAGVWSSSFTVPPGGAEVESQSSQP
jgi:hypothetical protein